MSPTLCFPCLHLQELTNKLRNIQSSVTGVLTVLDSSSGTAGTAGTAPARGLDRSRCQDGINDAVALEAGGRSGQSPLSNRRFAKSPVNLPLNPAGTLEKQMSMRQKEFEPQERTSQGQDAHLLLPNNAALGVGPRSFHICK
eukprot:Skav229810  [mRNA]  locus=scaffold567:346407:350497:- [translate_table: standard]